MFAFLQDDNERTALFKEWFSRLKFSQRSLTTQIQKRYYICKLLHLHFQVHPTGKKRNDFYQLSKFSSLHVLNEVSDAQDASLLPLVKKEFWNWLLLNFWRFGLTFFEHMLEDNELEEEHSPSLTGVFTLRIGEMPLNFSIWVVLSCGVPKHGRLLELVAGLLEASRFRSSVNWYCFPNTQSQLPFVRDFGIDGSAKGAP